MTVSTYSWEQPLLELAHDPGDQEAAIREQPVADAEKLRQAYRYCARITQANSRTFYMAASLLPPEKREAVHALYAFCRFTDDIVDRSPLQPEKSLHEWKHRVLGNQVDTDNDPILVAWRDTRNRYEIPDRYVEQLINGVAQDLTVSRYPNFASLATYCYGVASTVGLMAMHVIGYVGQHAIPYAVRLGVALQLTNILRDVGEDWRAGRLYLPQDELSSFGLTEADIANGNLNFHWRNFLAFQIGRARRLYRESLPGISLLHRDGRFAIAAAAELYQAILHDIEKHGGDVFNHRAHVSKWGKLRRLPGIGLRVLTLSY